MLVIKNSQVSDIIYRCERMIDNGADKLHKRKGLQKGLQEVNQGLGGLKVVQDILNSSVDAKSVSLHY